MFKLSPDKKQKLDTIIVQAHFYPFGSSKYEEKDELKDFVGREEEIEVFKQKIFEMLQSESAMAIRLSGPPGVGKTTLFNFVKRYIEHWRQKAKDSQSKDEFATSAYSPFDFDGCIVFSAYFQRPSEKFSFKAIWQNMMESLKAGFEKETGEDVILPQYVAILIIQKFIVFKPDIIPIIYKNKEIEDPTNIKKLSNALMTLGKKGVETLQVEFSENIGEFRDYVTNLYPDLNEKLGRSYNTLINDVFKCFNESDSYWEDALTGKIFNNEDDAIKYFNELCKLIKIFTGKKPVFLIGIDEFAKSDDPDHARFFEAMGNSLLRVRNELKSIIFTLISTDQDWANFEALFEQSNPLKEQLEAFWRMIPLKSLKEEDVIQLCKNRMQLLFWRHFESERDYSVPYYPFNDTVFRFLYLEHDRNLRAMLKYLNEIWESFKRGQPVPLLESEFDCIKYFVIQRKGKGSYLSFKELSKYHKEIIKEYYINHPDNQDNKNRSTKIEVAIQKAWVAVKNDKKEISSVYHEPKIKISEDTKQFRKPDVLVMLNRPMTTELRRSIEFQIKAYGPNSEIQLKDIESSLVLLNQGFTDLLFFIITGKGLSADAELEVAKFEKQNFGRIRRNTCSKPEQLHALYYLAIFDEINPKPIETLPEEARRLLETIMAIKIEDLIKDVVDLPFRNISLNAHKLMEEIDSKGSLDVFVKGQSTSSPSETKEIEITVQDSGDIIKRKSGKITVSPEKPPSDPPSPPPTEPIYCEWVNEFPWTKDYLNEITALFKYISERPSKYGLKFTTTTFLNHVSKDITFSRDNFSKLVKYLEKQNYIVKEKSSYELTKSGKELLGKMKKTKFEYHLA